MRLQRIELTIYLTDDPKNGHPDGSLTMLSHGLNGRVGLEILPGAASNTEEMRILHWLQDHAPLQGDRQSKTSIVVLYRAD